MSGRTEAKWIRLIAEYRASNESVSAFCIRHHISESSLYDWLAKAKQDNWNDISLVFNAATNKIVVKLNGQTLLDAVDASQTGYSFLDFSTFDVITEFSLRTEYFVDDIVYRRLPNAAFAERKSQHPVLATISPNPANEQIVISPDLATRDAWQVRLLNNIGQVILTERGNAEVPLTVATSNYQSGIYFVEFKSETEQWTKKVVIRH